MHFGFELSPTAVELGFFFFFVWMENPVFSYTLYILFIKWSFSLDKSTDNVQWTNST